MSISEKIKIKVKEFIQNKESEESIFSLALETIPMQKFSFS